jgi:hypothetical protein
MASLTANAIRARPRERSIGNSSRSEEGLLSAVSEENEEEHEVSEVEIDARERAKLLARPWWKRPSPWWSVLSLYVDNDCLTVVL